MSVSLRIPDVCKSIVCVNITESTAGADASVEVPKLHNIKLLIAFIHTLTVTLYHVIVEFSVLYANSKSR